MVYITLGPPQQKRAYLTTKYLEPLETWFYQDPAGALAPYFTVLFFKPSPAEDFRIYSPYQDRPDKLIASTNGVNDVPTALRIIKADLGDEIANLTLSLIPTEPVDNNTGSPSLESDALLNRIRDYRNFAGKPGPVGPTAGAVGGRKHHRVLLGQDFSDLSVMATRDNPNEASIHYMLRLLNAGDFVLGKDSNQRVYYSLSVESQLLTPDGKVIYNRYPRTSMTI